MTTTTPASLGSHRGVRHRLFLTEAVPELVRVNAFRVTQLNATASRREITRRVEKDRRAVTLDVTEGVSDAFLPAPGGVDVDGLSVARRLQDSERRLVGEVLWFCAVNGAATDDPELAALRLVDDPGDRACCPALQSFPCSGQSIRRSARAAVFSTRSAARCADTCRRSLSSGGWSGARRRRVGPR